MAGQLCWLPIVERDGENVLHLRIQPNQPWRPLSTASFFKVSWLFLKPTPSSKAGVVND